MESELFGHEKGAFTDAKESRVGAFEQAHGGAIFLDEIGELHPDAQVKLLRILEEKKITRVGGKKAIPVDIRIIAATNRNLEEEVSKAKFRLDLLYRLNVFTIHLPPLRERKEDIPLLTEYFINKHNQAFNLSIRSITQQAMEKIMAYHWPGNVRDLENAIQSAMILATSPVIQAENLPIRVRGYEQTVHIIRTTPEENPVTEVNPVKIANPVKDVNPVKDINSFKDVNSGKDVNTVKVVNPVKEVNAQAEKELIRETLINCRFNRTQTAEMLQISRKTLFNKMKRYGLAQ
jgi:DNA-binding NtrC family response regulator